ncbi:TldD/PmbA family protein [bacterium]|nr:TldD/PmbA family protein [bacterium]
MSKIIKLSNFPESLQELGIEELQRILDAALASGGDFADIYVEYRYAQSVYLEEGLIKETTEHRRLGAGIRVIHGDTSGFAYTNNLDTKSLLDAARTASAIVRMQAGNYSANLSSSFPKTTYYDFKKPGFLAPLKDKMILVRRAEAAAHEYDTRIEKVQVSLADSMQWTLIANSEGIFTGDARPQMRLSASTIAVDGEQRHSGHGSGGGRIGITHFEKKHTPEMIAREAAEEAITLINAIDAKAGMQPIVLSSKHSGVMIHEAVGHPLEGDSHWKKTAVLAPYWQKMVASPLVTIIDDPGMQGYRGSINIDDEGCPARRVTLIDKGRFTGHLHDRISAKKLNAAPNGHGRRDGYHSLPVPRMTNTFLKPGEADEESIIKSVKNGFYAHSYQGGMVQNSGKFTFSINLGWLIEDGRLTSPVKNATLIGHNLDILKQIEMVGQDIDWFLGTCGKEGQSIAVTAGTPTLKITGMTVGGQ